MSPIPPCHPAAASVSASRAACVGEARLVPASMNPPASEPVQRASAGSPPAFIYTQKPLVGSASEAMSGTSRWLLFGPCDATPACQEGSHSYVDSPPPDPLHPTGADVLPAAGSDAPPTATTYGDDAG